MMVSKWPRESKNIPTKLLLCNLQCYGSNYQHKLGTQNWCDFEYPNVCWSMTCTSEHWPEHYWPDCWKKSLNTRSSSRYGSPPIPRSFQTPHRCWRPHKERAQSTTNTPEMPPSSTVILLDMKMSHENHLHQFGTETEPESIIFPSWKPSNEGGDHNYSNLKEYIRRCIN